MSADPAPTGTEAPPEGPEGRTEPPTGSRGPSSGTTVPPAEGATAPAEGERERGEDGRLLSREAAGYRRRLREVESERDSLRARLDSLQTVQVETLAREAGMSAPSDIWAFGATLATLRGEDGSIDTETVKGTVDAILKDRPGLRTAAVAGIGVGRGAAASGNMNRRPVGLSQLLKPGHP